MHEEMFNILGHKEMQIKITLRFYPTPTRVAIIKNRKKTNVDKDVRKKGPLQTVSGNVNWCNYFEKSNMEGPQKINK
jgi:hypothetical protein